MMSTPLSLLSRRNPFYVNNRCEDFFPAIYDCSIHTEDGFDDEAFFNTLKVLLADRVSPNVEENFFYNLLPIRNGRAFETTEFSDTMSVIERTAANSQGYLLLLSCVGAHGISEHFNKSESYERIPKIRSFLSQLYGFAEGYKSKNDKVFVLVFEKPEANPEKSYYHYAHILQKAIPVVLGKFFKPKPLMQMEKDLLSVIDTDLTPSQYSHFLRDIVNQKPELQQIKYKALMDTACKVFAVPKEELERDIMRRLDTNKAQMNSLRDQMALCIEDYHKLTMQFNGIQGYDDSKAQEEFSNYISNNPKIRIEKVYSEEFLVTISTEFLYFEPELAELYIEKLDNYTSEPTNEQVRRFLRSAFVDMDITIPACANFEISPSCVKVCAEIYDGEELRIPNPHLKYYACLGGHDRLIQDALRDRDYVRVLELCIASTENLNFGDSVVMSSFIADVYGNWSKKIVVDNRTGEEFTPQQWVENLEKGEEIQA